MCWNRADGQAYRAVVSLTGDAVTGWEHLPGQQPNMTVDEWHECDEMMRAHPAVIEALGRRGITDLSRVLADMWAYGAAFVPERYAGRRIGWCDLWYRGSELGNPYAHHLTGLHPVVDLNTMELLEIEDNYQGGTDPEVMGEYLPDLLPMRLRVGGAARDQPARRGRLHARRHAAELAELAAAAGLQPPREPRPAPGRVPGRGTAALGRAPALVRRDGGAVPGRQPGPLPADRVRHRRVGPRLHDHLAVARLRLPGRDHLPGRGGARLPRRAGDHTERDLHPRGGQRGPVEARGRAGRGRGPPGPAAGALLPRDRGQLRVPGVLALLPGRQHRVRGPRDRDHGHLAHRRAGQPPGQRDGRRPRHLRAVPPALHRGPARPRRRRDRQHGLRLRVPAGPAGRRRPVRAGPDGRQHPAADRVGGEAGLRLGRAARAGRW